MVTTPCDEKNIAMMIMTKKLAFLLFLGNVVLTDLELRNDALVSI